MTDDDTADGGYRKELIILILWVLAVPLLLALPPAVLPPVGYVIALLAITTAVIFGMKRSSRYSSSETGTAMADDNHDDGDGDTISMTTDEGVVVVDVSDLEEQSLDELLETNDTLNVMLENPTRTQGSNAFAKAMRVHGEILSRLGREMNDSEDDDDE